MASKAQKELELQVHEAFYKNVHLLTLIYPPSKDFKQVFKEDMFVKNNKAGFQEVVYYLLGVLDFDKLKQKVPTWPLYDLRLESEFRNEVMKYINELNSIYEDANIPQLAVSQLISPGGFKFIKFIFKLSQFVLCEHLKRSPEVASSMLLPIKPSKRDFVTNENLEKMRIVTEKINEETYQLTNNAATQLAAAKLEAQKICEEQVEVSKQVKESQLRLVALQKQMDDLPPLDHEQMIHDIKTKLQTLKALKQNFNKCGSLSAILDSNNVKLEHRNGLKVPAEIANIVRIKNETLDLLSLVEGCNLLIDRKRLEVKPMSDRDLSMQTERFDKLNHHVALMNEDLDQMHSELTILSEKLRNESLETSRVQKRNPLQPLQLTENDADSTDSTVLATPLSPSPSPINKRKFNFN